MTFLPLDHLIFGNGYGLGSPYFDQKFYWLSGELYTFSAGLGAQLKSFQWTHPNAGEERKICGCRFRPLHSSRRWGRVMVAWRWVDLPRDLNAAHAALRRLGECLGGVFPYDAQGGEARKGGDSLPGSVHEHPVSEADAPEGNLGNPND